MQKPCDWCTRLSPYIRAPGLEVTLGDVGLLFKLCNKHILLRYTSQSAVRAHRPAQWQASFNLYVYFNWFLFCDQPNLYGASELSIQVESGALSQCGVFIGYRSVGIRDSSRSCFNMIKYCIRALKHIHL